MISGEHLFQEIELRAGNSRRVSLKFLIQLIGLAEYELVDLAVKLRKELQQWSIEENRTSNRFSERRIPQADDRWDAELAL
jgi:hypothetical protein